MTAVAVAAVQAVCLPELLRRVRKDTQSLLAVAVVAVENKQVVVTEAIRLYSGLHVLAAVAVRLV
jgi:hypothetical protein